MKFSVFTLRFAVVFAILALLLTIFSGCDSKKDLDRDKAEKIIKEFYGFPQVYRGNFKYGRINEYRDKLYPNLQKLASAGLITIQSYEHWTKQRYHVAEPTGMAEMFKVEDVKFSMMGEKSAWFVSHVADIKEVTGIVFNGEKTEAEVEYLIAYTKTTPFGEFLMGDKFDEYTKEGKKVKVKMKLYDDGWRVSDDKEYAVSKEVLEGGYEKYKEIFENSKIFKYSTNYTDLPKEAIDMKNNCNQQLEIYKIENLTILRVVQDPYLELVGLYEDGKLRYFSGGECADEVYIDSNENVVLCLATCRDTDDGDFVYETYVSKNYNLDEMKKQIVKLKKMHELYENKEITKFKETCSN